MRIQLSTKFKRCCLKNKPAMPLTISNFSRAWQAYFLSNTLQIWWENTSFINVQMMSISVFDTSIVFRVEKIIVSCSVHFYSLYLTWSTRYLKTAHLYYYLLKPLCLSVLNASVHPAQDTLQQFKIDYLQKPYQHTANLMWWKKFSSLCV